MNISGVSSSAERLTLLSNLMSRFQQLKWNGHISTCPGYRDRWGHNGHLQGWRGKRLPLFPVPLLIWSVATRRPTRPLNDTPNVQNIPGRGLDRWFSIHGPFCPPADVGQRYYTDTFLDVTTAKGAAISILRTDTKVLPSTEQTQPSHPCFQMLTLPSVRKLGLEKW